MRSRLAIAGVLFAVTWLLWSGMLKPLLLATGAASVAVVLVLAGRIGFFERSVSTLHLAPRLPRFWFWLIAEIVKANIAVARIILAPRLPISPHIVTIDAGGLSPSAQAVLANAITLTPGTLTLDVNDGTIEVHCLTLQSALDLTAPEFLAHARTLEEAETCTT